MLQELGEAREEGGKWVEDRGEGMGKESEWRVRLPGRSILLSREDGVPGEGQASWASPDR